IEHHKYKHNFDYHLALLMMAQKYYMNNGFLVLTENESPFSPVSQMHYRFYENATDLASILAAYSPDDIQCLVGQKGLPFGQAQCPGLADYADGINTLQFLRQL
ncbi:MAG: acyl-CoA reductase, partial [Sphingobacteriia bacterium]